MNDKEDQMKKLTVEWSYTVSDEEAAELMNLTITPSEERYQELRNRLGEHQSRFGGMRVTNYKAPTCLCCAEQSEQKVS